jgi:DNA-binding MarR family transcriptional regulator
VRRAEAIGLIDREPSSRDGRVAYLRLTPEAERRLAGTITDLGPERRKLSQLLGSDRR